MFGNNAAMRRNNLNLSMRNIELEKELEELKHNNPTNDPYLEKLRTEVENTRAEFNKMLDEIKEKRDKYDKLLDDAKKTRKEMIALLEKDGHKVPWYVKLKNRR